MYPTASCRSTASKTDTHRPVFGIISANFRIKRLIRTSRGQER